MKKAIISLCLAVAVVVCFSQGALAGLWAVEMDVDKVYTYDDPSTDMIRVFVSWNSGANTRAFFVEPTLLNETKNKILATLLTAQVSSNKVQLNVDGSGYIIGVLMISQ